VNGRHILEQRGALERKKMPDVSPAIDPQVSEHLQRSISAGSI